MSERMKQEERMQGVAPDALWQHRKRSREALQREMTGDYDAAARAWQQTANGHLIHSGECLPGKGRVAAGKSRFFVREVADGSHNSTESGISGPVRERRPA